MKQKSLLWKRIMGCALTAVMLAGTLAGCGSTEAQKPSESSQPAESSSASAASESQPVVEEEKPIYPMEGDVTLTVAVISDANSEGMGYDNIFETPFGKAWQENTGVTIEVEKYPDNNALNLMLASGEYPDIVFMKYTDYPAGAAGLLEDEVVVSATEYAEFAPNLMNVFEADKEARLSYTTENGEIIGFPFIRGDKYLGTSNGLIIRDDWLEELGLEIPETAEDLYNVLKAFQEEKGVEYPLCITQGNLRQLLSGTVTSSAFGFVKGTYYQEDGTIHYGLFESDGEKELLAWMNKLYEEKLINPNYAVLTSQEVRAEFMNGTAGVTFDSLQSGLGAFITTMRAEDPEWSATGFGPLVAKEGDVAAITYFAKLYEYNAGMITTACENVEAAARFLDYGYTEEGHMLFNFGIEGESYTMVDGKPAYTDLILKDKDGHSVNQMLSVYTAAMSTLSYVQDKGYLEGSLTYDEQREALERWTNSNVEKYQMPTLIIPEEDVAEYDRIWADEYTFLNEMRWKFLTGELSIEEYDTKYVDVLKNEINVPRGLEIMQAALDAYNAK